MFSYSVTLLLNHQSPGHTFVYLDLRMGPSLNESVLPENWRCVFSHQEDSEKKRREEKTRDRAEERLVIEL